MRECSVCKEAGVSFKVDDLQQVAQQLHGKTHKGKSVLWITCWQ